MEAFRKMESNVLITTKVLARGVDVDNVCLVVNYDVPVDKDGQPDYETYLHRIGSEFCMFRMSSFLSILIHTS
jgi:ATP-dependent RNA helicase DDX19/DBP5